MVAGHKVWRRLDVPLSRCTPLANNHQLRHWPLCVHALSPNPSYWLKLESTRICLNSNFVYITILSISYILVTYDLVPQSVT
jgi:hypothetical protein